MTSPNICSVCVMEATTPGIEFDANGQCNYCRNFQRLLAEAPSAEQRAINRAALIAEVKRAGRGKRYDCVVGVSGGADSSFALVQAVKCGLRPLATHLDNGWNSELAVHNIATLVRKLGVDLHTHVIRWDENRDLQRAFFAANVVDIEMLMDSAMRVTNSHAARRWGVRHILSGNNSSTEGMIMPPGWNHHKWDATNARAIHRRFGTRSVPSHPFYSLKELVHDRLLGIDWVSFLDYFDYHKADAIAALVRDYGYKPYPYKHYESVFTRFYQGAILPGKFGIDKRRLHLSTLIVSLQLSRADALAQLEQDPYPDPVQKRDDREFVLKKLGLSESEFDAYMAAPPVPHSAYPSEEKWLRRLSRVGKAARRLTNRR